MTRPRFALGPSVVLACLAAGCGGGQQTEGETKTEPETETGIETGTETEAGSETETGGAALPGACAEPIAAVVLADARLSVDAGGVLRDALGRDVVMRGLNTGNRNKTAPYVPFPISEDIALDELRAAADEFFAPMPGWGMDTARLLFSWQALEPARDVWDEQYLDRYEVMVDAAWDAGLRVIVDFHQDIWSEDYCGDGFPSWAAIEPEAAAECPDADWGLKYLTDAGVRGSFDRFWANEDELVDEFYEMWTKMAERVGDHPGVVALEILNEPGWGSNNDVQGWKSEVLEGFHSEAAAELHALAPELLVIYDNPGIDGAGLYEDPYHQRPEGEFLVYGPHLYGAAAYDPDADEGGDDPDGPGSDVIDYAAFGRAQDVHVLLGEFGFQPAELAGPQWLTRVAEAIDDQRISATMWEYSVNETLWNHENFSMVDGAGNEQVMLDSWVRPWLRAVSGEDASFAWHAESGVGEASWVSDGGVSEIVLPPRLFPEGPADATITGEGACFTVDPGRGELRVSAPAGVSVGLSFSR
ncbi:cellulase family glycosylhydrolase [Pseudenhygromyxa sp. WMMC2535]|uniref:cellulase family glycosylhydrolase n=1 Tax=Pseudenhygromyxa sp. WMMC2535 TaxID=2712867 RepID=UPI001555A735|nr:cellulase family glycosylhydrolase [Pseudenhygromyxa sp. WMMC2535]NVB42958.1 cellulase family glycosylhydrolase [Pseudenhygromyxa sp. WMMC2535]